MLHEQGSQRRRRPLRTHIFSESETSKTGGGAVKEAETRTSRTSVVISTKAGGEVLRGRNEKYGRIAFSGEVEGGASSLVVLGGAVSCPETKTTKLRGRSASSTLQQTQLYAK